MMHEAWGYQYVMGAPHGAGRDHSPTLASVPYDQPQCAMQ